MFNWLVSNAFGEIYTPQTVAINLAFSFLLSLIVAIIYKNTHRGLSYSQAFVINLILVSVIITGVMMVIGNNIATAFGAFGAFSLVRFRTAIKDPRDMSYIFLVLAVGMAVGTNNYDIALFMTVASSLIILALSKLNFASIRKYDYILSFTLKSSNGIRTDVYQEVFSKYLKDRNILNINTMKGGKFLELSFSIKFFNDEEKGEFVKELGEVSDIFDINLIAAKNDIEY